MALVLQDRVLETCTSPGTGSVSLLGAVTGYQAFSAGVGNGNTCYYTIADQSGPNWEVGIGTYSSTGNILTRTTIIASSNSNTTVNFSSGTQNVFVTYPAEKAVYLDSSGALQPTTAFTALFASPPALGGTAANTGAFTTLTASADSSFTSTGALLISKGTTGQQPGTPATGMIRYNTTTNRFEGYAGSSPSWLPVGTSAISNDTTTATAEYPLFASATSGSATTIYTSSPNYTFTPSTGELSSSAVISSNGLTVNANTVTANYTVAAANNAISAGPIAVASGVTVTVSSGSTWVVV